jgi:hypothetical protein
MVFQKKLKKVCLRCGIVATGKIIGFSQLKKVIGKAIVHEQY